jgi:Pre-mRNA splicing Prp18-interacting factor
MAASGTKGKMNYEAKRDRWNNYDSSAFKFVVDEWNQMNEEAKKKKNEEL